MLAIWWPSGNHYDNALLTVKAGGDSPVEYVKIKMEQVFITSVATGGRGQGNQGKVAKVRPGSFLYTRLRILTCASGATSGTSHNKSIFNL